MAQRLELKGAGDAPIGRAGQDVLDEEADVAAAEDQVEWALGCLSRPPALQPTGQGWVRFGEVLVLVEDDEQRRSAASRAR